MSLTALPAATRAAGPGNNEHGANENLDMSYAKELAAALALTIAATAAQAGSAS